jgi:hypothetical protein
MVQEHYFFQSVLETSERFQTTKGVSLKRQNSRSTKDCVLVIKPRSRNRSDKKLKRRFNKKQLKRRTTQNLTAVGIGA